MRKFGEFVAAITVAALIAIVFSASLATPSAAQERRQGRSHAYDGLWSVSIRTQSGPCDPSYRYPARIVGGQIVPATSDFSYHISGNVVSSGAIAVTVSQGLQSATGYGRPKN